MIGSFRKSLAGGMILLMVVVVAMVGLHVRTILATAPADEEGISAKTAIPVSAEPESATKKSAEPEPGGPPTLWEILKNGGLVMLVLFIMSILTIALIIYYSLAFRRSNLMPPKFVNRLKDILSHRRFDEAAMFCRQNNNIISNIVKSGIDAAPRGHAIIQETMNNEGARQASTLWQKISYLNDLAIVAPMLGLLGTVVGMLDSFLAISARGGTSIGIINPAAISDGVAKAMITTVAGLSVGIIATIAYAFFRGVVQRLVVSMETAGTRFSELIEEEAPRKKQ